MRILCDRCKQASVDYDTRKNWGNVRSSEQNYGELGNYFLCENCMNDFYKFMENKSEVENER